MFDFLFKKKVVDPQPPVADSGMPPLPPNHFFRVVPNTNSNSKWPLVVEVRVKKMYGSRAYDRFVDLSLAESTPESIADSMWRLSARTMAEAARKDSIAQYCGDYYP